MKTISRPVAGKLQTPTRPTEFMEAKYDENGGKLAWQKIKKRKLANSPSTLPNASQKTHVTAQSVSTKNRFSTFANE